MTNTLPSTREQHPDGLSQTVPEKPATLRAQMNWLAMGKRKVVLVTPGEALPEIPLHMAVLHSRLGLFIYDRLRVGEHEIFHALATDRLGDLLGYGIKSKPEPGREVGAVVVRSRNGHEKQAVVTDLEHFESAVRAAQAVADAGDTVGLEPCEQVLDERMTGLLDAFPKLLPITSTEEVSQVNAAAADDNHHAIKANYWMEKDGEIVGAAGANTVPLCTIWFHRKKLKARDTLALCNAVENLFRAAGHKLVATMVKADSPFAPVMERMGYHAVDAKLYMRKL